MIQVERLARAISGVFHNDPGEIAWGDANGEHAAWEDEVDGAIEVLLLLQDIPNHIYDKGFASIDWMRHGPCRESGAVFRAFFRATVDAMIEEYETDQWNKRTASRTETALKQPSPTETNENKAGQ